ncbi:MAG: amidohydrolase, partial [Saprospiraceae bacterium]
MKSKFLYNLALLFWVIGIISLASCNRNKIDKERPESNPVQPPDIVFIHADLYPVKGDPIQDGAVATRDGKIVEIGKSDELIKKWKGPNTEMIDCHGAFLMPGFIEGHGHLSSLGFNLINVDLMETRSWQDVVDSVANRVKNTKPGEWILGRGWHQEKWTSPVDPNVSGYPYHDLLSQVSPQNPVMLSHASGHSLFVNEAAMKMVGVSRETPDPVGGHIIRDASGNAIGVFEERAMDVFKSAHVDYQKGLTEAQINEEWFEGIRKAQHHCLQYGITSFQDAGSSFAEIKRYAQMAADDSLDFRLWVMLRHPYDTLIGRMDGFPIIEEGEDMFTCRAIKSEVDGALGSYGAWLLEPYKDRAGFKGQNTTSIEEIRGIAEIAIVKGMQLCVHAIGDRANHEVLNIFEQVFAAHPDKKDLRWRIEHAQHLNPSDIPRFKELGVIASMQGIHCTSDAPFVEKRLGEERARTGAYAWRSLLDQGVVIANGTDTP